MQLAESAQVKQITVAKAKGASFALSPIDPLDFVEAPGSSKEPSSGS